MNNAAILKINAARGKRILINLHSLLIKPSPRHMLAQLAERAALAQLNKSAERLNMGQGTMQSQDGS